MSAIKSSDLGKCYKKSEDGFYRLYKVEGSWAIYLVVEGEATFGGYLSDKDNFDYGVMELEEEARAELELLGL